VLRYEERTGPRPRAEGEVLIELARCVAQPSRHLDPQGSSIGGRSRGSSGADGAGGRCLPETVSTPATGVVINPGPRASVNGRISVGRRATPDGDARRVDRRSVPRRSIRSPDELDFENAARVSRSCSRPLTACLVHARRDYEKANGWLAWGIGSGVSTATLAIREGARRTGDRHVVEPRERLERAPRARRRRGAFKP